MRHYKLSREIFGILEDTFGSKEKAEIFAGTFEEYLDFIDEKTEKMTVDKLENIRLKIKEDLSATLVTRELFDERMKHVDLKFNGLRKEIDERFNSVDIKFKSLNFKFNILIALTLAALTLANPAFMKLLQKLLQKLF